MVKILYSLIPILFFISCGKEKFPDYRENENEALPVESSIRIRGNFVALNHARIRGTYLSWIEGNQIYFAIQIKRASARTRIQQYVHTGSKCPGIYSDLNKDGKTDYSEILVSTGEMLIPLDKKLNQQLDGSDWFPITDEHGFYSYSRAGSVGLLVRDLRDSDEDTGDSLAKLSPSEDLSLSGRTIVLYGTDKDPLLPVACAEL